MNELLPVRETMANLMSEVELFSIDKNKICGLTTGFDELDKLSSGLHPGSVTLISGRPHSGKTSFLYSILTNVRRLEGLKTIALFDYEYLRNQSVAKLLSADTGIDLISLRCGRLTAHEWKKLEVALELLAISPVYLNKYSTDIADVRRMLLSFSETKKVDLVLIHNLQLIPASREQMRLPTREQHESDIMREIKQMAMDLETPILVTSEVSPNVENRPNKRPYLSDFKDCPGIVETADIVCFVYRDEVYHPETEDAGLAEIIVAKNRYGSKDTVRLKFIKGQCLFESATSS